MSELPRGWVDAKLSELAARITKGATPTSYGYKYQSEGVAFVKVENLKDGLIDQTTIKHYISDAANENQRRSILQEGDILFSIAGTLGETCTVTAEDLPANTNQALAIIRGTAPFFLPQFLMLQLSSRSTARQVRENERGGGMHNLSLEDIGNFDVVLAPVAEQRRIVAKLDALLARVDACRQRLDKIPKLLARFRQSVLAAACSGRLTEDWRSLRLMPAAAESVPPDDAPEVPQSWCWCTLNSVADIRGGVTKGRNLAGAQTVFLPYLRVANVQDGFLDLAEIKQIEVLPGDEGKYALLPGDILFTEGGDRDKLGRGAVWNGQIPRCIHQNHIFRARTKSADVLPRYVSLASKSEYSRAYFFEHANQTVNLASINVTTLSGLPLAIPPQPEQEEIVRRVNQLFAFADRLEARVQTARKRVDALTQSILAKAFRGELVPTEAELAEAEGRPFESAEQLLNRIRTERESTNTTTPRKRAARTRAARA